MKFTSGALFSFLFLLCLPALCQEKPVDNICICSDYHSLMDHRDLEKLFPPDIIRTKQVSRANVHTVSRKVAANKNDSTFYTEVVFMFDKDGYIKRRIEFYNGKVNCSYDYGRDSLHRIITETFNYVDSTWKNMDEYLKTVKDYTYDEKGRLVKIKQEGRKGEILADDRTMTETFQYDDKGRQTYRRSFIYYEGKEPNSYETKTKFASQGSNSTTVTMQNGREKTLSRTAYNEQGLPVTSSRADYWSEEKQLDETWVYDEKGRVLKYTASSTNKFSECPEKETFNEEYVYAQDGLLSLIKHVFILGTCDMYVDYK